MNANESADSFKPGQRVMLKSGGPSMTVVDVGQFSGDVLCHWAAGDRFNRESFPAVTLKSDSRTVSGFQLKPE